MLRRDHGVTVSSAKMVRRWVEKEKKAAAQGAFEDRPVFAGKRRAEGGDVSAVGQPPKRRLRVKTRVAESSVAVPARDVSSFTSSFLTMIVQ